MLMATYKVLQDIEAEDKFVGPLTLKQFILAGITFVCGYLSFFFFAKHVWFLAIPLLPVMLASGFLAFPWGRDQPTEIWLLAKLRFFLKPKRRIWDQSGIQELVTITVPKKVDHWVGDNLTQTEVRSRLKALANTIDSRGWAVKNVNVNLYTPPIALTTPATSDRLIDASSLPQAVASTDIQAADDILDERNNPTAQHLNQMITASTQAHRQEALAHMHQANQPTANPKVAKNSKEGPTPDYWFMNQSEPSKAPAGYATFGSRTVLPGTDDHTGKSGPLTPSEQALLEQVHIDQSKPSPAYGNTKVIQPISAKQKSQWPVNSGQPPSGSSPVTSNGLQTASRHTPDPAILNLANNDDLNVATIAREANKKRRPPDGGEPPKDEVVVPLR